MNSGLGKVLTYISSVKGLAAIRDEVWQLLLFCLPLFLSQTIDISIFTIDSCIQDVNSGLGKVLTYISSVKGLAAIRDEVWQLLHDDNKMTTWDIVCDAVLDKKLLIWDSLFRELFLTRTKVLS